MATDDTTTDERERADETTTDETREREQRVADLEAQLELLRAENERLRDVAATAKRSRYRRAAAGLVAIGLVAIVAGGVFPDAREVLFALGGTGVFAGLLTYYLTPERFIPASVGERVYAALAGTLAAAVSDLGLSGRRVYVPVDDGVRLYVPQRETDVVPSGAALGSTFVVGEDPDARGLATTPTGEPLYEEFSEARTGPAPTDAAGAARQLRDGLLEVFEFGDAADVDVDLRADGGRVTLELTAPVYGPGDRFDHPAVSFVAVGLARALDRPVRVEVVDADPLVATFRWERRAER